MIIFSFFQLKKYFIKPLQKSEKHALCKMKNLVQKDTVLLDGYDIFDKINVKRIGKQ